MTHAVTLRAAMQGVYGRQQRARYHVGLSRARSKIDWNSKNQAGALRAMLAANGEEAMLVQPNRRSFMAGMAATATAGALLPVAAIARDASGASEGFAYRTAGDLVKAIAGRQ